MTTIPPHPARWSQPILDEIARLVADERADERADVDRRLLVLDPFAGVGVPRLEAAVSADADVIGLELEPEWARTGAVVADARRPPVRSASVDVLATSPAYGNRMSDSHEPRDACKRCVGTGVVVDARRGERVCPLCKGKRLSKRNTYKHTLGRHPSDGSAAVLRWGPKYRRLHEAVWRAANDALRPGALVLVNVKNHVETYGDESVEHPVTEWHLNLWLSLDAKLLAVVEIDTPGQRHGANRDARADCERLLVLRSRSVSWRR